MNATSEAAPPYRRVGRRYELTRDIVFQTDRFGPVVLTRGYRSNGSSSPLPDSHRSRMAAFLHDALYAASGHLRFPGGHDRTWSRADADAAYCAQLLKLGVAAFRRRTNCTGAHRFGARTWDRLAAKRDRRWKRWDFR